MSTLNTRAMRPVLVILAMFALSACSATVSDRSSAPPKTAGSGVAAIGMKNGCPCHAAMKEKTSGKTGRCSGMKDGCSCAEKSSEGGSMMCQRPDKTAGMSGMDHSGMVHGTMDLYAPAMKSMHENMTLIPTGDADVDFMRGMIPHHQGAVDMAKIVLGHGRDPAVRGLAQAIIRSQEGEIAFMRKWLETRDQK